MAKAYNIIEIANVHGGDINYLKSLIAEFTNIDGANGIKFQPFKYDEIALPDFPWYDVYVKLFFKEDQWKEIIKETAKSFDVWIDTFDDYSLKIIQENLDSIHGLKFQASILYNKNLLKQFEKIDLHDKIVVLNISGLELSSIQAIINDFTNSLKPKEIVLQVGFQGYPTALEDNGLNKITILKNNFNTRISFTDHLAAESEESLLLPVFAVMQGAEIIEKHVCLSGPKPEYDHYSSLTVDRYKLYLENLSKYTSLLDKDYINAKEANYLNSTIQIPVLNKDIEAGKTPNLNTDFVFKRSSQSGLRTSEVANYINSWHVLNTNKKTGETLKGEDFKKANIASVVACRLKSSRLPKKALLKIGELTSVEFCLKNVLKFKNINHTILATSDVEEDAELVDYTYASSVIFHKGHPLDVIKRYLDIIEQLKVDVIVRVTADMPYVSDEILQPILKSHFESGADYSRGKAASIGTNLEVINVAALKKVKKHFPNADYSEYMTWYFTNNSEHFKINEIDLSAEWVRDYRLTLDYPEDLELFNKIESYFTEKKIDSSLKEVIQYLDKNPDIANINRKMETKYLTDQSLIDTLNKVTKIN